jgi:putative ABC transport system permease protein
MTHSLGPEKYFIRSLVIIQFAVATGLTIATIIAVKQLKYIQHYNLGFNKNSVAVIHVSYTPRAQVARVMDKIRNTPGVMDVTGSLRRLGNNIDQNAVIFKSGEATHKLTCATMFVDYNCLNFYNIPLIAGRNLSSTFGADRLGNSYIINETLARQLTGQTSKPKASLNDLRENILLYVPGFEWNDCRITKDFNFNSLHQKVEPLSITYQYDYYFSELSVRLSNSSTHQILSSIEQEWDSVLPSVRWCLKPSTISFHQLINFTIRFRKNIQFALAVPAETHLHALAAAEVGECRL